MSFLFGIERQFSNKSTGFGTFIFVSVGSYLLGELSLIFSPNNVLLIVGGVVTGIGFLGAGALIKTQDKIFGFTTSASIWIFSIIGLCVGLKRYDLAIIGYLIVWIVILTDKLFEKAGIGTYQRRLVIKTNKIVRKEEFIKFFKNYKWKLLNLYINKKDKKMEVSYLISCPKSYVNFLNKALTNEKWVEEFKIE
jgi:putative Mg2+ transporter-C (MgtC) family protein